MRLISKNFFPPFRLPVRKNLTFASLIIFTVVYTRQLLQPSGESPLLRSGWVRIPPEALNEDSESNTDFFLQERSKSWTKCLSDRSLVAIKLNRTNATALASPIFQPPFKREFLFFFKWLPIGRNINPVWSACRAKDHPGFRDERVVGHLGKEVNRVVEKEKLRSNQSGRKNILQFKFKLNF